MNGFESTQKLTDAEATQVNSSNSNLN